MENIKFLKSIGYSNEKISQYIDAILELVAEDVCGDGFDAYVRSTYPGMCEALENKDALNLAVINHLAKQVTK